MMEPVPRVGVAIWIFHKRSLLLGLRIKKHGEGCWAFPGGHLEFGESLEACAARETMEEVGLRIKNVGFYALTNDIFSETGKHYITIHMQAEADGAVIVNNEPDKHLEWRWFPWGQWPQPLFLPITNVLSQNLPPPKGAL
jgi:8-oxo-dGTP diphosphatase